MDLSEWILSGMMLALDLRSRRSFAPMSHVSYVPRRRSFSAIYHAINSAADSVIRHIKTHCATPAGIQLRWQGDIVYRLYFILAALTSPVATLTLQTALGHIMDSCTVV